MEMFGTLKKEKDWLIVFVDILTPCFTVNKHFLRPAGTTPAWNPVEVSKMLGELGPQCLRLM